MLLLFFRSLKLNHAPVDPVIHTHLHNKMGTESEALRWKQWIDRWIKISAPDSSTPSIAFSVSSSKIDASLSSSSGQRKSLLTTEQLRYQLINMVKVIKKWFKLYFCNDFY